MFTIIMQSYLGDYPHAASNREEKFLRAVRSVLNQTYKQWELIVISHGCDKTIQLCYDFFVDYSPKIRLIKAGRKKQWEGTPRNIGIEDAQNDYCIYLDSDDYYLPDYLEKLSTKVKDKKVYFVDEYRVYVNTMELYRYRCQQGVLGKCGTSNVVHRRDVQSRWVDSSYGYDDYTFLNALRKETGNFAELDVVGYVNCHIPRKYDI